MTNKALVLYSPYCILCIEIAVNILKKHGTGLTGLELLFCFVLFCIHARLTINCYACCMDFE